MIEANVLVYDRNRRQLLINDTVEKNALDYFKDVQKDINGTLTELCDISKQAAARDIQRNLLSVTLLYSHPCCLKYMTANVPWTVILWTRWSKLSWVERVDRGLNEDLFTKSLLITVCEHVFRASYSFPLFSTIVFNVLFVLVTPNNSMWSVIASFFNFWLFNPSYEWHYLINVLIDTVRFLNKWNKFVWFSLSLYPQVIWSLIAHFHLRWPSTVFTAFQNH